LRLGIDSDTRVTFSISLLELNFPAAIPRTRTFHPFASSYTEHDDDV
jgi:hypothetical protein